MSQPRPQTLPSDPTPAPPAEAPYPSSAYAWYCVIILLGIYINSFLDRQILGLLVGPIRQTFGVSDTVVGLLQGPAFAILYAIAGLPLGVLADRVSRRMLIFGGQIVWTLGTVAFGMGDRFASVFAARVVVGVGEATLSPSAYSMIADLFRPDRLARALSFYGMGIYIGGGMAALLGGYAVDWMGVDDGTMYQVPLVGQREAWQMVFLVVAVPTIPLSILLLLVREPVRRGIARAVQARAAGVNAAPIKFGEYFRSNGRTLLLHHLGFAALSFAGYGAAAWNPEFFVRIHELPRADAGKLLGWISLIMGPAGIYFGGWLGDRLTRMGYSDGKVRVGVLSALVGIPFGLAYPLMPETWMSAGFLACALFAASMNWGVAPAAVQEVVPPQLRGQASALYLFVLTTIGLGLGPSILPIFTDYVFQDDNRIHHSLVSVGLLANVLAATCLISCLPHFRRSMAERMRTAF